MCRRHSSRSIEEYIVSVSCGEWWDHMPRALCGGPEGGQSFCVLTGSCWVLKSSVEKSWWRSQSFWRSRRSIFCSDLKQFAERRVHFFKRLREKKKDWIYLHSLPVWGSRGAQPTCSSLSGRQDKIETGQRKVSEEAGLPGHSIPAISYTYHEQSEVEKTELIPRQDNWNLSNVL